MNKVRRFDIQKLDNIEKTAQGFLKIPVYAARTGIQTYRDSAGNEIKEYRPAEEVFADKAMATLANAPITNNHPKEMVTTKNVKKLQVGFTGDIVQNVDNKFLKTTAIIQDQEAIDIILGGKVEVSMGYDVELEMQPGTFDGHEYDAIQRNIVHNHLAIVDRGRAGHEVRFRLDSGDAILIQEIKDEEDAVMAKLKIGDTEFEIAEKELFDAVKGLMNDRDKMTKDMENMNKKKDEAEGEGNAEKVAELEKEIESKQGKIDALEEDLKKAQESKGEESKMDSETIMKMVRERKKLEKEAEKHLDAEEVKKLDDMNDMDIKKAVILKESPEAKLDGKSDEYVNARFDHICETVKVSDDANQKAADAINEGRKQDAEDTKETTAEEARKARMKRDSERWKQPVGTDKTKNGGN